MIQFGSNDARLAITTEAPSKSQVSVVTRMMIDVVPTTFLNLIACRGSANQDVWAFYFASGGALNWFNGTAINGADNLFPLLSVPIVLGFTYDAPTVKIYINGWLAQTGSASASANTAARLYIGNDTSINAPRMQVEWVKIWSGASGVLTADEMRKEAYSTDILKTAGIWANWQGLSTTNLTDASNGRVLVKTGTTFADTADNPPTNDSSGSGGGITAIT